MTRLTRIAVGAVAALAILATFGTIGIPKAIAQIRAALVKNVDEPGRAPFQFHQSAYVGVSSPCGLNFCDFRLPAVPAGKRLVITNIALRVGLPATGVTVGAPYIYTWDSASSSVIARLHLQYVEPYPVDNLDSNARVAAFNQTVLYFVEAGQHPTILIHSANGNLNASAIHECQVTGYFVDLAM